METFGGLVTKANPDGFHQLIVDFSIPNGSVFVACFAISNFLFLFFIILYQIIILYIYSKY